jgi:uncharacterized MnhB-related membrane protein
VIEVFYACLILGAVVCAVLSLRATHLLASSLWLAGVSILLSVFFYLMDAPRIAVIELSVGAGLVTVLLVFAIGIAGDAGAGHGSLIARPISWGLALLVFLLLGWFILPLSAAPAPASEPSLASLLWEGRALDVWIQVVLIFVGVLGILGLLEEIKSRAAAPRRAAAQTLQVLSKQDPDPEIQT